MLLLTPGKSLGWDAETVRICDHRYFMWSAHSTNSYTSALACCSGRARSSSESPAQDPRKMSSGPTAHMQDGGAAALTFDTCSATELLSKSSCVSCRPALSLSERLSAHLSQTTSKNGPLGRMHSR